jgi:hypothetical protein
MASTSRASSKTVEDAEIFQVLEESTDSDATIFSSQEDDGSESDSDEDGQLDDNSERNKKEGTCTSGPKSPHLNWTNTLNFKGLEKTKIYRVLNILYQLAALRKNFEFAVSTVTRVCPARYRD